MAFSSRALDRLNRPGQALYGTYTEAVIVRRPKGHEEETEMSARSSVLAVAALVLALIMIPAWASAEGMRYGVAAFGGYQTYSMSDMNDAIAQFNADAQSAGATGSFDDIKHGIGFGGGLHAMNQSWIAALEYVRLNASSSADFTSSGTTVSGEIKVPANGVTADATYLFPTSGKAHFGVGAGLGYYSADGTDKAITSGGSTFSNDITGHAFGFHGMGVVDSRLSNVIHLELQAGYRYAKTSNVKENGVEVLNADGSKAQIDWSGLMTRFGLTFFFGQSH